MALSIKTLLQDILNNSDNWQLQLLKKWPTIVGTINTKVQLLKIQNDTLVLGVMDSCWMQELYLLQAVLIKKINENLDQPRIKKLRFKTIGIVKEREKNQVTEKKGINKTVKINYKEQEALKAIKDPQLQKLLHDYLIRCYQERE
jgi:flagellar biogenesis protein FliO